MKLDKTVEPLARGHARARPPALRARPQVRRADPGRRARRPRRPATRSRSSRPPSRSSSRTSSRPSTTRRARRSRRRPRASATRSRAAAPSLNRRSRRSTRSSRALTPVMQNLSDPDTELDRFFSSSAAPRRRSRRWPRPRRSCSRTWPTPSTALSAQPRRAAGRRSRSRRPRWTSAIELVPRAAARSSPTSPTCPAACARRPQELPRSLPAINRALAAGTPVLPRTVGAERAARGRVRRGSRTCSRTRTRCSPCATSTPR